ncbi:MULTISPECIES: stage V sporulation protein AE [Alteribacter]|uniref:Stage V sporulation protein AE n=1 Tax=Alteribacter keqinensis TaxID=2483800 RepID=A0A3M7TV11_9BACI|nr:MULTISPECIES: stage V sporulation protein AE [Alteribacter]MBM7094735.1 stage V sporulation protein AE [Alteribacter salitolerans]RNA69069.1 stage V sporulation protein AE [Alteribacter keqinensis]
MEKKKRVILITDGDTSARMAVEAASRKLNCCCISKSGGNPSPLSGEELVELVMECPDDPVVVLFDDCGYPEEGPGEKAMITICNHPDITILGALAVASQSYSHEWAKVHFSLDRNGDLTEYGVDKDGIIDTEIRRIRGDTVYILDQIDIPIVIGIGDLGKMGGRDSAEKGAPITTQAIQTILERSQSE